MSAVASINSLLLSLLLSAASNGIEMSCGRVYPKSFRSILELDDAPKPTSSIRAPPSEDGIDEQTRMSIRCHCGDVSLPSICLPSTNRPSSGGTKVDTEILACHCGRCRKAGCSAFGAWARVPPPAGTSPQQQLDFTSAEVAVRKDTCSHLGAVERYRCGRCHTVLGIREMRPGGCEEMTEEEEGAADTGRLWVAMGAVVDSTVPRRLASRWQSSIEGDGAVCKEEKPTWVDASPRRRDYYDKDDEAPAVANPGRKRARPVRGGCSCGSVRYEISPSSFLRHVEFQHCYCNLCRRMSGSAYQTWVPVMVGDFQWTSGEGAVILMRTTGHGQRHACGRCGSVLTIVYDGQLGLIWPAAGGFNDDDLPGTAEELSARTSRVIHICCSTMPSWYRLPDDSLPRLENAC